MIGWMNSDCAWHLTLFIKMILILWNYFAFLFSSPFSDFDWFDVIFPKKIIIKNDFDCDYCVSFDVGDSNKILVLYYTKTEAHTKFNESREKQFHIWFRIPVVFFSIYIINVFFFQKISEMCDQFQSHRKIANKTIYYNLHTLKPLTSFVFYKLCSSYGEIDTYIFIFCYNKLLEMKRYVYDSYHMYICTYICVWSLNVACMCVLRWSFTKIISFCIHFFHFYYLLLIAITLASAQVWCYFC